MDELNRDYLTENMQVEDYDDVSTLDNNVVDALSMNQSDFTINEGVIDFDDILIPDPIKKNRKESYMGLSKSVAELGIVTPIHVMISEGYSDWVEDGSEGDFNGFKYILLDGFRRIWAGYKNGLKRTKAIIWDFRDKEKGTDLAVPLSRVLNKNAKHTWGEIWYMYQVLESQSSMSPGSLEYLLQLEPGDAMKLKDIMQSGYPEVVDDLMSNKKTLSQAYNMLQKLRKEEDVLVKEDNTGIAETEQAEGIIEESRGESTLTNDEVNEILEMEDGALELKEDDFDEMLNMNEEVQKVGERHPLDPALKAETLLRDGYNCVCCNSTKFLPMRYKLSLLQSHHKIAVAHGGPDSASNIVTLCMSCHTLVHCILWSGLKFGMSKEDFENLPEDEKSRLEKIMQIARYDWLAAQKMGKTADDIKAEYVRPSQFKMPGTDLRENTNAIKASRLADA